MTAMCIPPPVLPDALLIVRLNQAVMVFLGLAVSPRTGRKGE